MGAADTLDDKIATRDVVDRIRSDGYCFLEALLDRETVNSLNAEFKNAFQKLPCGVSIGIHPPGQMASIDTHVCNHSALPTIFSVFFSPPLKAIAESFSPAGSRFNEKIALTHETTVTPISDLHFDSQRALKFLVYLVDTDDSNGAFGYVKGSHVQNTAYREKFLSQGGHLLDLQNVAAEQHLERHAVDRLDGPAGSMIIFDTDGWHVAGCLADNNKERKIIRGRSPFPGQPDVRPKRFSPMWFRRTFHIFPPQRPFEIPNRHSSAGTSRKR